jgi:Predicted glycosyl hydrolase
MEIHVVIKGDTIYSIAEKYGITVSKLIQDNGISNPNDLVIGQTIVIAYPKETYIVKDGDTLKSIADISKVTLMQILRNNPFLSNRKYIYPGEELVISYDTNGLITTNGIAYPYIGREELLKTLPNLSYLSVFNYKAEEKGKILAYYDDTEIIQIAKAYGTLPLMLLSTLTLQGASDFETAASILSNEEYQDYLIDNILKILKDKGYSGLNMVFNFINTSNENMYKKFINRVSSRVIQEGYLYFATINPSLENVEREAALMKIDYTGISETVNGIILLKYVWGMNNDPPSPVSNISSIRILLEYLVSMIPENKIMIGEPLISYDWLLPFIPGKSSANALTLDSALNLAKNAEAEIQFDEISQTPFFHYDQSSIGPPLQHIVWSLDARSINALVKTVKEYLIHGISFWNVMIFYPQIWLVINSQYEIVKLSEPFNQS